MRADNTGHLRAAVALRQDDTRRRAGQALSQLQQENKPITISDLARAAGIARSWIYTQPDLLTAVRETQVNSSAPSSPPSRTGASQDSWRSRLRVAHDRIHELTEEVRVLRYQLARAHGQLRTQRTSGGSGSPDEDTVHNANSQLNGPT
ncbi:MAG TPA: DUF6262 family protein [Pseudonocardiaceae bacterium]|nr:DUF6262 family protein [Pseudonocardiaceae bacterium]